jgi:hypothetical protein
VKLVIDIERILKSSLAALTDNRQFVGTGRESNTIVSDYIIEIVRKRVAHDYITVNADTNVHGVWDKHVTADV